MQSLRLSPDTRRSVWWLLSFLFPLGSDVSLHNSSYAAFSPRYFGYYDDSGATNEPVGTCFSETSVCTHLTTRCQRGPSSACLPPPLQTNTKTDADDHLSFQQWNIKHYATFRVETQVNLASQSVKGNTAVDTGKRRCKAPYTTT